MQFNYTITPKAVGQITQFYCNVALKYRHAYSIEDMERNIRQAVFSAYLIERSCQTCPYHLTLERYVHGKCQQMVLRIYRRG